MRRLVAGTLIAVMCCAPVARATPGIVMDALPPPIAAQAGAEGGLDGTTVWAGDFNSDGIYDAIEQSAYAIGGNSVRFVTRIYVGTPEAFVFYNTVDIGFGAIMSTDFGPGYIDLIISVLLESDARCCPSGRRPLRLRF